MGADGTVQTTPDKSANQVREQAINTTRAWFVDSSHGTFSGYWALAFGPLTVHTTQRVCSDEWNGEIADQAEQILKEKVHVDPLKYTAVVYYFSRITPCIDSNGRDWAGKGGGGSNRVFLNGDTTPRTVLHELGHNLGLRHAGALTCSDGLVPLAADCGDNEYGDTFSAMGNVSTEPYSPDALARTRLERRSGHGGHHQHRRARRTR